MNVRFQFSARFMAGAYQDDQLLMNEYTVKIYMMTMSENLEDHNIALSRIKYFLYNELTDCVFINEADVDQCQALLNANINITTLPADPVDQVIGIMLYSKLSAIVENRLLIGEVEVSSMLGDGIVYLHGEHENVTDFESPDWFTSNDLVHCDISLINDSNVVALHQTSVWRDLNLAWAEEEDEPTDDNPTGNTIVLADFKKLNSKE